MAREHERIRADARIFSFARRDLHLRIQRQEIAHRTLQIGRGKHGRHQRGDAMIGGGKFLRQRIFAHIAHILIVRRLPPGPAIGHIIDAERLAMEKLGIEARILGRLRAQCGASAFHMMQNPLHIARRFYFSGKMGRGQIGTRGRNAGVVIAHAR